MHYTTEDPLPSIGVIGKNSKTIHRHELFPEYENITDTCVLFMKKIT